MEMRVPPEESKDSSFGDPIQKKSGEREGDGPGGKGRVGRSRVGQSSKVPNLANRRRREDTYYRSLLKGSELSKAYRKDIGNARGYSVGKVIFFFHSFQERQIPVIL